MPVQDRLQNSIVITANLFIRTALTSRKDTELLFLIPRQHTSQGGGVNSTKNSGRIPIKRKRQEDKQ
jgi:hypothetical protein